MLAGSREFCCLDILKINRIISERDSILKHLCTPTVDWFSIGDYSMPEKLLAFRPYKKYDFLS
jgi:hypothetical protein